MKKMKFISTVLVMILAVSMLSVAGFATEDAVCTHENVQVIPGVAATCCADGKTEGKVCVDCGVTVQQWQVIPATGDHDVQVVPGVVATCCTNGKTEGQVCTNSGKTLVQWQVIPATGDHEIQVITGVDAACDTDGKTEGQVCTNSGKTLVQWQAIPATGHSWDDGVEADGVITYTCAVCGETKTESVAPPTDEPVVPPTDEPVVPDEPVDPPAEDSNSTAKSPKTGDNSVAFFLAGMLTITAAAVIVIVASKKSRASK